MQYVQTIALLVNAVVVVVQLTYTGAGLVWW